jgi:lysophospholipase L1-like esterase
MEWYEDEVRQLIQRTQRSAAAKSPPVFYGSSSIRLWETMAEDVGPGIVNLGFGGSTLEACDYFFERIVPPVKPSSLLLYAGDNDLGDGRSADQTFASFRALAARVINDLGPIPFGFISIKPSPARFPIVDRIAKVNQLVRAAIEAMPSGYFVDVFPQMLNAEGKPDAALFQPDGLHMSRAGYRLWSQILSPYRNRIFTK